MGTCISHCTLFLYCFFGNYLEIPGRLYLCAHVFTPPAPPFFCSIFIVVLVGACKEVVYLDLQFLLSGRESDHINLRVGKGEEFQLPKR